MKLRKFVCLFSFIFLMAISACSTFENSTTLKPLPTVTPSQVRVSPSLLLLETPTSFSLGFTSPSVTLSVPRTPLSSPTLLASTVTPDFLMPCLPDSHLSHVVPDEDNLESYIGYQHYNRLFPVDVGFEKLIGSFSDREYTLTGIFQDNVWMLILERSLCHDIKGRSFREVRDIFLTPFIDDDELLTTECHKEGDENSGIVAIGQINPKELKAGDNPVGPLRWVWQIDSETEKLEQISPDNVSCTFWIGQH